MEQVCRLNSDRLVKLWPGRDVQCPESKVGGCNSRPLSNLFIS